LSRSERNREGRHEQLIKFLNVRVEDSKLFEEKKEKESINYTFTRGFKLSDERFIRFIVLNRLFNFTANFCFRTRTRHITPF